MRYALEICVALLFVTGCGPSGEPTGEPSKESSVERLAPVPPCRAQDRTSCTVNGRSFRCDNGSWHPPGRPGSSGVCLCDGNTKTCG
jgi:hypothetical protein